MAKKKKEPEDKGRAIARLSGTLSRVHGLLRLHGTDFSDRWDALDAWCKEKEIKNLEETHKDLA